MATTVRRPARPLIDWPSAVGSGALAGVVFLILELVLVPLFGLGTAWAPTRMIAAIALGSDILQPPTFNPGIVLVALVVHFALSIAYAMLLAGFVAQRSTGSATLVGVLFGIVLYIVNFFVLSALFPWFATARNLVQLVIHAVFGGVAGYAYRTLSERRQRPEAMPAERREPAATA